MDIRPILNDEVFALADVNHDGSVDLQDVQMVLQAYLGLIELQETTAAQPTTSESPSTEDAWISKNRYSFQIKITT